MDLLGRFSRNFAITRIQDLLLDVLEGKDSLVLIVVVAIILDNIRDVIHHRDSLEVAESKACSL